VQLSSLHYHSQQHIKNKQKNWVSQQVLKTTKHKLLHQPKQDQQQLLKTMRQAQQIDAMMLMLLSNVALALSWVAFRETTKRLKAQQFASNPDACTPRIVSSNPPL
jgi:hypothetical protein